MIQASNKAAYEPEVDLATDPQEARLPVGFCNTWPFPSSDLDLVLPADNAAVHRARGCCDGGAP